ncbi:MAG: RluA family pseudouridine synthase [Bacillota bacterium]|nr:RluA family pseudouridine synthase [Bacillota bacterium]
MQIQHVLTHQVLEQWHGDTVRNVLTQELGMARQVLTRLKRSGSVLKNGQPCYIRDTVEQGDMLTVVLREELEQAIEPENIPIAVVYEDDHLLVVNKPAGLVVHPTKGYMSGTLANAVIYHWALQGKPYVFRPVHRLDRDTSGLVVIAKNPYIQEALTAQHHTREWTKKYLCLVTGIVPSPHGCIEAPIARVGNGSRARVISAEGKSATTLWELLALYKNASLLRAELVTGRTHQIRVHFAHIGHPLIGDDVYGNPSPLITRQALHAAEICFTHPISKSAIHLSCPLPEDMMALQHHSSLLP